MFYYFIPYGAVHGARNEMYKAPHQLRLCPNGIPIDVMCTR